MRIFLFAPFRQAVVVSNRFVLARDCKNIPKEKDR